MSLMIQEYQSPIWAKFQGHTDFSPSSLAIEDDDIVVRGGFPEPYFSESRSSVLLKEARECTTLLHNSELSERAYSFLSNLQRILNIFERLCRDLRDIPHLAPSILDDDSILFEWDLDLYRLGFSIEANPQESSWYLVTTKELGNIKASGLISVTHSTKLLAWLTGFVMLRL